MESRIVGRGAGVPEPSTPERDKDRDMVMSSELQNVTREVCKVCRGASPLFGRNLVLRKHQVSHFRCERCGFIQTEEPYWLDEAYSTAIASQDVGIMQRNLYNCEVTSAVLQTLFPKVSRSIDFGAGHGVLVRLMRDRGYNFFWSDRHAANDYARGFESSEGLSYEFLTAFEVLEHFTDPLEDIGKLMELGESIFVSTLLVPEPAPALSEWWYYAPTSGQHVSFYTLESLRVLAARFGRHLLSAGPYHLFTREKKNRLMFQAATRVRAARLINRMSRRGSLIESDYEHMTRP